MMGREECSLQMRRLLPCSRVSALHLGGGRTYARPISLRTHRSSHAAAIAPSAQGAPSVDATYMQPGRWVPARASGN
jgi:hypothetical protein